MNKRQQKRLLYHLNEMSDLQAFFHLIGFYLIDKLGFLRGTLLEDRRARKYHLVGDRRVRPPHMIYSIMYALILYTIMATIFLITSQNIKNGAVFLSVFAVLLFFVIKSPKQILQSIKIKLIDWELI